MAAETAHAFEWADNPQNCPFHWGISTM